MSYADVPAFMERLRLLETTAALALEFCILAWARSGEVLGARWNEFDLSAALWTVPPSRMKGGTEHQLPMSLRALTIVKAMHEHRNGDFIFPGGPGKPLGQATFQTLLKRMGIIDATVHGFRSAARYWAGDKTGFAHDVIEAALAHAIQNETEAAYRRGTALEKRRKLMEAWAAYCERPAGAAVVRPQFGGQERSKVPA